MGRFLRPSRPKIKLSFDDTKNKIRNDNTKRPSSSTFLETVELAIEGDAQMNDYRTPASFLRIVFPAPGFFLNDTQVSLAVNGAPVHVASFKQGFDWWAEVPPGQYSVVASIAAPLGISRTKAYGLEVRPGLTTIAVLAYSRFWGNFEDRPARVDFVPR